ncbi:MAG: cobalt-precorrin-5B (C(1))-methyltransferase CbiD [bacterium]
MGYLSGVEGLPVNACQLREGFTTGACAAAAVKASLMTWVDADVRADSVDIPFPSGERFSFPIEWINRCDRYAEAAVRKDAGDDPDITQGVLIVARVAWCAGHDIVFEAGAGVGRVTKPGLSIPPGEPAINPGPRNMMRAAIREVSDRGVCVTVSIPGGEELANKTFNPRLGIVGGLSVLGTTGRVRPFSCQAIRCSVACELDVAKAAGITHPVLVPGHIGERSARRHLKLSEDQLIEVGNEWGFVLEGLLKYNFEHVLLWGHPGKLAKLAGEEWDTHSSRSRSAIEIIREYLQCGADIRVCANEAVTAEGFFEQLEEFTQKSIANRLSQVIAEAAQSTYVGCGRLSVALVNLAGDLLGSYGGLEKWR